MLASPSWMHPPWKELPEAEAKSVRPFPAPLTGGFFALVFWVCRPCGPALRSADLVAETREYRGLLLLRAGDIETNPGPTRQTTQTWTCDLCNRTIARNQYSILCNSQPSHWIHKRCSSIRIEQYHNRWTCRLHPNSSQPQPTDNDPQLNNTQSDRLTRTTATPTTATSQPQPPYKPALTNPKQLNILQ